MGLCKLFRVPYGPDYQFDNKNETSICSMCKILESIPSLLEIISLDTYNNIIINEIITVSSIKDIYIYLFRYFLTN